MLFVVLFGIVVFVVIVVVVIDTVIVVVVAVVAIVLVVANDCILAPKHLEYHFSNNIFKHDMLYSVLLSICLNIYLFHIFLHSQGRRT